ncbi:MAG: hypothetical protein FD183_23 [Chitinophagaceae bacterium]|nr:MAG: hypothetical protein FD183_23 [Chitinophagaceae bacterium]
MNKELAAKQTLISKLIKAQQMLTAKLQIFNSGVMDKNQLSFQR